MNDPTRECTCKACHGKGYDDPPVSECCTAPMTNYPDSDLCPDCLEHSNPSECEYCGGTGVMSEDELEVWNAEHEYLHADTYYKRKHGE